MTSQTRVTITAGIATLLGAIPLAGGFAQQRWFGYAAVAVMVVTVVGVLLRRLRTPAAVTVVVQLLGLLVFHTVTFASSDGYGHIIPNGRTLSALATSVSDGLHDIQYLAAPVPARTDIVVLTSMSVGLLAVVVDLIAVSVQRPAVAGLALLALFAVATAVSARTLFFEFAGAGTGYLLLLAVEGRERLVRWGRVVGADDQPGGTGTDHAVVRTPRHGAAGRVGVAAVAAALVIPMLVPGFTTNVLGAIGHGSTDTTDGPQSLGSGLNPFSALKGSLDESHTFNVMSVTSNVADAPWYLRVTVLDQYTASGWRRGPSRDALSQVSGQLPVSSQVAHLQQEGHTRSINAKVRITSYRDNRLPVYYAPTSVTGAGKNWLYDQNRSEVLATKGVTDYGLTYTVHASEPDPSHAELLAAGNLSPNDPIMRYWGAQPPVTPKVRAITNGIIAGLKKPYERADAINDYFTDGLHGFTYNLQTKSGSSDDDLQNFLEEKQGYCEQYASAMAVMLRLAGVPSRVVLGYAQGTQDSNNPRRWTISNHDAHAWVEGYFNGIGWVEFDPTPRDDGHTSQPAYRQTSPTDPTQPTTAAPSGTTNTTTTQTHATQTQSPLATGGGGSSSSSGGSTTPATVGGALALLALVALLLAPAATRVRHRRRRYGLARGPDPGAAAHACWAEILDTMADLGIAPGPSESPRATAARLVGENALDGPAKSGLSIVALAEERARYAAEAGVDADLATALRAARAGLLGGAGVRRKIWIAVAAPAVMQQVGAGLAAGSARTSAAIASLGRALRLRGADR